MISSGPRQNFLRVEKDFSDLETQLAHLRARPEQAARIASNGVEIFRDRYLTPAAQSCYWRKLIRGYGSVSFKPLLYESAFKNGTDDEAATSNSSGVSKVVGRLRGTPFETYVVLRRLSHQQ